jgi:subtilisin family serine protease
MHISLIGLLIAGEIFLVVLIAWLSLLWINMHRRRRDRQAALYLVGVIKNNEGKRLDETRALLENKYGYNGSALAETAQAIVRAEKLLYQRVINMYVKRDVVCMRELNIDIEAASEPLRALEVASGDGSLQVAVADNAEGGDRAQLREENAALKQELQITMETMSRMLGEYASMFGGGPESQTQSGAMQQMLVENEAEGLDNDGFGEEGEFDSETGMAETMDGLDELDDLALDDSIELPQQASSQEASADATVMLDADDADLQALDDDVFSGAGDEDLSFDEFDKAFDIDESASTETAASDTGDESMDGELADMWADAMAEQDETEKK